MVLCHLTFVGITFTLQLPCPQHVRCTHAQTRLHTLTQTRSRKHFPRKTQKNSFCVERNRSKTNFYCYLSSYSFFSVFYLKDENCTRLTRTRAEGQVILLRFYPLSALPSIPATHPPTHPTSSSSTSLSFLKCRCFDALCAALPKFYPLASHFLIFKKYQKKNEKEKRGLRRGRISFTASQLTQPIGNCCISLIGSRY